MLDSLHEMLGVKEKEKAKHIFNKMDRNMDGKVSKAEFLDLCKREKHIF